MDTPGRFSSRMEQGTVWSRNVALRTGTVEDNAPVDLTGCEFKLQLRSDWGTEPAWDAVVTCSSPETGIVAVVIDDRERVLPVGALKWDFLIVFADASVKKLWTGTLKVFPTASKIEEVAP